MGKLLSAFDEWRLVQEILEEDNAAMFTIDDPRFVSYHQFVEHKLYLRWHAVHIKDPPAWTNDMAFDDIEDTMTDWLRNNCRGAFMTRFWNSVSFENRQDALLFKMSF